MQNNIYNYALRRAYKDGEINIDALCEMCDQMDEGMRERFVSAILLKDYRETVCAVPVYSEKYGQRRRRTGYNFLKDIVYFEYNAPRERWFETEEMAREYEETNGAEHYYDGSREKTDTCKFVGVINQKYNSETTLEDWIENAVTE